MITFDQFKTEWETHRVGDDSLVMSGEESNDTKYQCVSLIKQYVRECYGLEPGAWGNAIQWWTATNPGLLTKFTKDGSGTVQKGDIVVLRTLGTQPGDYSGLGHIGIATGNGDPNSIEILEQNGLGSGTGLGGDAIRTRFIPRNRLAGILRPIFVTPQLTFQRTSTNRVVIPVAGAKKWDLNLIHPTFQAVVDNPVDTSDGTPRRIQGILIRSDFPEHQYYLEDYNQNYGWNTLDCLDYVAPAAPYVPPAAPANVQLAEKYTLVTTLVYYPTAEDAKQRTAKAIGPVFDGSYYVVKKDGQAYKLSKDNKQDIGWININDNRLPEPTPEPVQPTLPVDPPPAVTETVNLPPAPISDVVSPKPISDITTPKNNLQYLWLRGDRKPVMCLAINKEAQTFKDLLNPNNPVIANLNPGSEKEYSMFTLYNGEDYYIPTISIKNGWRHGIPKRLLQEITLLDEVTEDVVRYWNKFEELPKKVYTLISDISPVKRHELVYKGKQVIDGFRAGKKK